MVFGLGLSLKSYGINDLLGENNLLLWVFDLSQKVSIWLLEYCVKSQVRVKHKRLVSLRSDGDFVLMITWRWWRWWWWCCDTGRERGGDPSPWHWAWARCAQPVSSSRSLLRHEKLLHVSDRSGRLILNDLTGTCQGDGADPSNSWVWPSASHTGVPGSHIKSSHHSQNTARKTNYIAVA